MVFIILLLILFLAPAIVFSIGVAICVVLPFAIIGALLSSGDNYFIHKNK